MSEFKEITAELKRLGESQRESQAAIKEQLVRMGDTMIVIANQGLEISHIKSDLEELKLNQRDHEKFLNALDKQVSHNTKSTGNVSRWKERIFFVVTGSAITGALALIKSFFESSSN